MENESLDPSVDNSITGRFARHRDRIEKLEAFIEAVTDIYPNLDDVYQRIHNPPPRSLAGQNTPDYQSVNLEIDDNYAPSSKDEIIGLKAGGLVKLHTNNVQPDYQSVKFDDSEDNEYAIFYKGGQISMNEIVLRLNRLSALEKQNDNISMLVLNWTEKTQDTYVGDRREWVEGYHAGINECRENISDVWAEGWKQA